MHTCPHQSNERQHSSQQDDDHKEQCKNDLLHQATCRKDARCRNCTSHHSRTALAILKPLGPRFGHWTMKKENEVPKLIYRGVTTVTPVSAIYKHLDLSMGPVTGTHKLLGTQAPEIVHYQHFPQGSGQLRIFRNSSRTSSSNQYQRRCQISTNRQLPATPPRQLESKTPLFVIAKSLRLLSIVSSRTQSFLAWCHLRFPSIGGPWRHLPPWPSCALWRPPRVPKHSRCHCGQCPTRTWPLGYLEPRSGERTELINAEDSGV